MLRAEEDSFLCPRMFHQQSRILWASLSVRQRMTYPFCVESGGTCRYRDVL